MAVVTAQGIARPFDQDGEPYPVFGSRLPALRSFRLTYPAPNDHQIALMQVLVGGSSEDLTPNAENNPSNIPDGRLFALLQDRSATGEEYGYLVSHSTLSIPGARRFQLRDVGCVGKCVRVLPPEIFPDSDPSVRSFVLVLVGFKLFFTGARDHELDRVGVWFHGKELHVALRDVNGGDVFGYLVDFLVIPTVGLSVSTGIERGSAVALQTIPFPEVPRRFHFMLTGWAFNFRGDDQEILDIGVIRRDNDLTMIYRDNNSGDAFDWRVEWAEVGPIIVDPT